MLDFQISNSGYMNFKKASQARRKSFQFKKKWFPITLEAVVWDKPHCIFEHRIL